jgi:subtilisin family serine protease
MRATVLVLLLAVALLGANAASLLNFNAPNTINGSYIVVLQENFAITDRDAHILALQDAINQAGDDSEVGFRYGVGSFVGFSARLSDSLLKQELAHPDVQYIEVDQIMHAVGTVTQTSATWGLDRIDQRSLPLNGNYVYNSVAGSGVNVFVVDTGILTTHVDFNGRATAVFNAITSESSQDLNGHGTHCAGTIGGTTYGVAKQVKLKGVKVLGKDGSGTNAGVIAGVDYVGKNAGSTPAVASMSLGGGASSALDAAVTAVIKQGIPFAIAAGNENQDACNTSPARVATAVTVGATDKYDYRAEYSNWGACLDIFAPGTDITSDWIGSNNKAVVTISGTSMATPHVAGVIALRLSLDSNQTPAQITSYLTSTADQGVLSDVKKSPNLLLYSSP